MQFKRRSPQLLKRLCFPRSPAGLGHQFSFQFLEMLPLAVSRAACGVPPHRCTGTLRLRFGASGIDSLCFDASGGSRIPPVGEGPLRVGMGERLRSLPGDFVWHGVSPDGLRAEMRLASSVRDLLGAFEWNSDMLGVKVWVLVSSASVKFMRELPNDDAVVEVAVRTGIDSGRVATLVGQMTEYMTPSRSIGWVSARTWWCPVGLADWREVGVTLRQLVLCDTGSPAGRLPAGAALFRANKPHVCCVTAGAFPSVVLSPVGAEYALLGLDTILRAYGEGARFEPARTSQGGLAFIAAPGGAWRARRSAYNPRNSVGFAVNRIVGVQMDSYTEKQAPPCLTFDAEPGRPEAEAEAKTLSAWAHGKVFRAGIFRAGGMVFESAEEPDQLRASFTNNEPATPASPWCLTIALSPMWSPFRTERQLLEGFLGNRIIEPFIQRQSGCAGAPSAPAASLRPLRPRLSGVSSLSHTQAVQV